MSLKKPAPTEPALSPTTAKPSRDQKPEAAIIADSPVPELGGPSGPEPTRYGDWERGGRCTDF